VSRKCPRSGDPRRRSEGLGNTRARAGVRPVSRLVGTVSRTNPARFGRLALQCRSGGSRNLAYGRAVSSASRVRRLAVVAAPALAALLIVVGFFADPAIEKSGRELAAEYAAHPDREQVSALAFHFAFALLAIPAVAVIVAVRDRGAWLANVAALLAFLGMTTLPGFLLTDFYDIAIYGELGGDAWDAVDDRLEEQAGATIMFVTGFFGFVLTLPVALLGAWRAGMVSWWPAALLLAGGICSQAVPDGLGLLIWAATVLVLSFVLWRLPFEPSGSPRD
jgi:hypothetical protein